MKTKRVRSLTRSRKASVTPLVVMCVVLDIQPCSSQQIQAEIQRQMRMNDAEFEHEVNYSFVPNSITPLLEKGWLLRKWDGVSYTFSLTLSGQAELDRNF